MNHNLTATHLNKITTVARNTSGALTSFEFFNKAQKLQLKTLQTKAIDSCNLLTPYNTINRKGDFEGLTLSIIDVHFADNDIDYIDGLIIRANAVVVETSSSRARNETHFFLVKKFENCVIVKQLPSNSCSLDAKNLVGLGRLVTKYVNTPQRKSKSMKEFSFLLEKAVRIKTGLYPLIPATTKDEIIKKVHLAMTLTG